MPGDRDEVLEQYHCAVEAVISGETSPLERLWSRREDVTVANPLGPPARGWDEVSNALRHAVSQLREGEGLAFERISGSAGEDLASTLEIERCRVKVGGAPERAPSSLRVTTIFRRERDGWKIVHRHVDPITTPRPIESVVGSSRRLEVDGPGGGLTVALARESSQPVSRLRDARASSKHSCGTCLGPSSCSCRRRGHPAYGEVRGSSACSEQRPAIQSAR